MPKLAMDRSVIAPRGSDPGMWNVPIGRCWRAMPARVSRRRGVFLPFDKLATCVICCRKPGRQGLYEHPKLSRAVFNEARPLLAPRFSDARPAGARAVRLCPNNENAGRLCSLVNHVAS